MRVTLHPPKTCALFFISFFGQEVPYGSQDSEYDALRVLLSPAATGRRRNICAAKRSEQNAAWRAAAWKKEHNIKNTVSG